MTSTVSGKAAAIKIGTDTHATYGISDFSLSFDRGTIEQELVGETGNYFLDGALSIDGSYTCCKFASSGNAEALTSIINSTKVVISGSVSGSTHLGWYFVSCQITGYDVTIGDADTISEASIDFTVLDPYNTIYTDTTGWVTGA